MTWGPELTEEEREALEQRLDSIQEDIAGLAVSLARLAALEDEQEIERDADKKMYDWFSAIAWYYEIEYRQYIGYYWDGAPLTDADLEAAAKNEYDTKLFPAGWTDLYEPKFSIPELNAIPDNATDFDLLSETAINDVTKYAAQGIRLGKTDDTEPGDALTATTVTSGSTLVEITDETPFTIGKWALLRQSSTVTLESRSDGQCLDPGDGGDNKFESAGAGFATLGVGFGDLLVISAGANQGEYPVVSVESETVLYVATAFPSVPSTNEIYDITRTTGNKWAVVDITDIIILPPKKLEITVLSITGSSITAGAFIGSGLLAFRDMLTTLMSQLVASLELQKLALAQNDDNISSGGAEGENTVALEAVNDVYNSYLQWLGADGILHESGSDGQCLDPGAGADDRFTSVSALFQSKGVQPGAMLTIPSGVNAGTYTVALVESQTSLRTTTAFPSVPSAGETYDVSFGSQWDAGVLQTIEDQVTSRQSNQIVRKGEIERSLTLTNGIYDRRKTWVNALVNRASGSWSAYENTKASIVQLEDMKAQLDELDDAYEEFLDQ